MTAIKICGITREDDAAAAVALGADAVGFILWPGSPRGVAFDQAARIVKAVPATVSTVGVFVNPTADDLERAAQAGFAVAQVHGEVPERREPATPIRIMRAVRLSPSGDGIEPEVAGDDPVLLDAQDPVLHGGTGKTVDWQRARVIAAKRRVFLAGGLKPENVAEAIRTVRPYAVDVASGVEASPGMKDHDKLKAFIQAVKETV